MNMSEMIPALSFVEVASAVVDLSPTVKTAWVAVAVWAAVQAWSYTRVRVARVPAVVPVKAPTRAPAKRKQPDVAPPAGVAVTAEELERASHALSTTGDSMYR